MLRSITVLDFETSGLDPRNDRVIEMAAIRVMDGRIASEFRTVIPYDKPLPRKITEITGLTDDDLEHGMDEVTAFKILNRFIGNNLIVAHNAAFDLAFLHYTLKRLAGRSFNNPFIDTLTVARDRSHYPYTLSALCERYGASFEGAHRALNDVHACWRLLENLHNEAPLDDYVNRLGYLRKYGPPRWAPEHALLVPQENRYAEERGGSQAAN